MAYTIQIDTLIKLPNGFKTDLKVGDRLTIEKDDERLVPLHKPVEFCDNNYHYIGKLQVNRLTLQKAKTTLEVEILSIFTDQESAILSKTYLP